MNKRRRRIKHISIASKTFFISMVFVVLIMLVSYGGFQNSRDIGNVIGELDIYNTMKVDIYKINIELTSINVDFEKGDIFKYKRRKDNLLETEGPVDSLYYTAKALKDGDETLGVEENKHSELDESINELYSLVDSFVYNVKVYANDPTTNELDLVLINQFQEIVDKLDEIIMEIEEIYDASIIAQRNVSFLTIILTIIFLISVIYFYNKIKSYENSARLDDVTNLYNMAYFDDITRYLQRKKYITMFIDLDGFKSINKKYGYKVGNDVLEEFGKRLLDVFYEAKCFRFGNDEFIVFIQDENDLLVHRYIMDLQQKVLAIFVDKEGILYEVDASIGVVGSAVSKEDPRSTITLAGKAMLHAKRNLTAKVCYLQDDDYSLDEYIF